MFNSIKKIICITGADGTGKSTLINGIKDKFDSIYVVEIWDVMNDLPINIFTSKKQLDDYICSLTPNARLLFLSHAMNYAVEKGLESKADLIILNGYYYKYFVSELGLGADEKLVELLLNSFLQPDLTIQLKLDLEESCSRKIKKSRYECGTVTIPNDQDFLKFQNKIQLHWKRFQNSDWQIIDARQSIEQVLLQTLELIESV